MKIETLNIQNLGHDEVANIEGPFRISSGDVWFEVREDGEGIQIRSKGQMIVRPTSSNTITIFNEDY